MYENARQQRLNPKLMELQDMSESREQLHITTQEHGDMGVIQTPMEIHQCPAYFMANHKGLTIPIEIPIISTEASLFALEFQEWPIKHDNDHWHNIDIGPQIIVITNREHSAFRTMTHMDWEGCYTLRQPRICKNTNILRQIKQGKTLYHTRLPPVALIAGTRSKHPTNRQTHAKPVTRRNAPAEPRHIFRRHTNPEQATTQCQNLEPKPIPATETNCFTLPTGCTAQTARFRATIISYARPAELTTTMDQYHEKELTTSLWNSSNTDQLRTQLDRLIQQTEGFNKTWNTLKRQWDRLKQQTGGFNKTWNTLKESKRINHIWTKWSNWTTLFTASPRTSSSLTTLTMITIIFQLRRQIATQVD
jgi:hypothetical protein